MAFNSQIPQRISQEGLFITSKNLPPQKNPTPWSESDPRLIRNLRGVCLDIDETLSTHGKLTAEAFTSLWALKKAGFWVVPVTGRPAGWCDHIARFWPVDAVIGENGAFAFFMENGVRKGVTTPEALRSALPQKKQGQLNPLEHLRTVILQSFPEARWASDQAYREHDLAIDICEDVSPWPQDRVQALIALCHKEGAHAKLSSIHVNTWYGDYDKQKGFSHWLSLLKQGPTRPEEWIYIGDSPNDEPLFQFFKLSVGVANLRPYLPQMKFHPTWLTSKASGEGFAELVQRLIVCRASQ